MLPVWLQVWSREKYIKIDIICVNMKVRYRRQSTIFDHRHFRAARHIADVRGTLAPQPRRGLLEEIVVDEPYLLQTPVL
jgi:hypothetical protein